jgi:hypothetical protein
MGWLLGGLLPVAAAAIRPGSAGLAPPEVVAVAAHRGASALQRRAALWVPRTLSRTCPLHPPRITKQQRAIAAVHFAHTPLFLALAGIGEQGATSSLQLLFFCSSPSSVARAGLLHANCSAPLHSPSSAFTRCNPLALLLVLL